MTKDDLAATKGRLQLCQILEGSLKATADRLERIIEVYEENLKEVEALLRRKVAEHELTPYLLSLSGVGPHLAAAFLVFIGDGQRFRLGSVASWIGSQSRLFGRHRTLRFNQPGPWPGVLMEADFKTSTCNGKHPKAMAKPSRLGA